MLLLPILAAAGAGVVFYNNRSGSGTTLFGRSSGCGCSSWCYDEGSICWLEDKAPECEDELRTIRRLSASGSKAYRLDPHRTVASYLNRSFIRPAYRGREFLVEHTSTRNGRTVVYISFDDSTHMAFELYQPYFDCCQDIWVVSRYAYLDENPNICCG